MGDKIESKALAIKAGVRSFPNPKPSETKNRDTAETAPGDPQTLNPSEVFTVKSRELGAHLTPALLRSKCLRVSAVAGVRSYPNGV